MGRPYKCDSPGVVKSAITPILWSNPVDWLVLGPELLKETELIVKQVQGNLKVAQDRQKSQVDLKRTQKETKNPRSQLKLQNKNVYTTRLRYPR